MMVHMDRGEHYFVLPKIVDRMCWTEEDGPPGLDCKLTAIECTGSGWTRFLTSNIVDRNVGPRGADFPVQCAIISTLLCTR